MASYSDYQEQMQKIADFRNALAVLQWDQEVYLPPKGAAGRARQMASLSEQIHALATDQAMGDLMEELLAKGNLSASEQKNLLLSREDFVKQKKYPGSFVRTMSETVSRAFHSWLEARKKSSFAVFREDLDQLIRLKKEEAEILGYSGHPYNALLNEYEKGASTSSLDEIFLGLRPGLHDLLGRIVARPQVDDSFLHRHFSKQAQWEFGLDLIRQLDFDFEAGRQDISEHPFTTSFNPGDVRITTRIDENNFANMTWSCIHEAGHAIYEQGLPDSEYGLPSGEFASLGIHESQSRLWENSVGRSRAFWSFHYPELVKRFPEQLDRVSLDEFYRAINKVQPSLIRTEADELTYHFHVMIRYELEKALLEGSLATADIPAYWKEQYSKYLGVEVKDDKEGCLQDVHWSHGSFGYFPTYSLGSFYAAQFFQQATRDIPSLPQEIKEGKTASLRSWLKDRLFRHGRLYTSDELCRQVTGKPLAIQYFMDYLLDKYKEIYDL